MIGPGLPLSGTIFLHITHVIKATKFMQQCLYSSALQHVWDRNIFQSNSQALGAAALSYMAPCSWLCTLRCSAFSALQHAWGTRQNHDLGPQTVTASLGIHLHLTSRTNCCPRFSPCSTQWDQGAGVSLCFTPSFLLTEQGTLHFVVALDKLP